MKKLLFLGFLLASTSSFANVADQVCYVDKTQIAFDLSTSSPLTEGSRFFNQISLSKSKSPDNPDLVIRSDSKKYIIDYADGFLEDGAPYFVLRIQDRNNPDAELYAFSRGISESRKEGASEFSSDLPEFKAKVPENAIIYCEGD